MGIYLRRLDCHWIAASLAGLSCAFGLPNSRSSADEERIVLEEFRDEQPAHSLYDQMLDAMRQANSLAYTSNYTLDTEKTGRYLDYTYRVWLKKPNYFRVELESRSSGKTSAILIGDGNTAWMYWPQGRPVWEFIHEDSTASPDTRNSSYWKRSAPAGGYSIGHSLAYSAKEMSLPIVDPSIFHGLTDSLQEYLDGVKSLGIEHVNGETCDKIEVSFMGQQRRWILCLSQRDHLPRRLEEVVRGGNEIVTREEWSALAMNSDIADSLFQWQPPDGWTEWRRPDLEDMLLTPGTKAPDFELTLADGGRARLSSYRGQVTWLYFWRAGCPACRLGMPAVQELYTKYREKGLATLGFNSADEKDIALEFMRELNITFPTILDSSAAATKTQFEAYRCYGVPANYIIDRNGIIVDAWYEDNEMHDRALAALKKSLGESAMEAP